MQPYNARNRRSLSHIAWLIYIKSWLAMLGAMLWGNKPGSLK